MSTVYYSGKITVPGVDQECQMTTKIDEKNHSVSLQFEEPIGGKTVWHGINISSFKRTKYHEISFQTIDLPLESIELVWKFNASFLDDSLAAVIVPKANKLRVSGEKGFILNKSTLR